MMPDLKALLLAHISILQMHMPHTSGVDYFVYIIWIYELLLAM